MFRSENRPKKHFPITAFASILVITLALFVGVGWQSWHAHKDIMRIQGRDIRLLKLVGIIIHLDEVLTMSARMGVETGNLQWEERYLRYEPQLEAAIKEAGKLAPEAFLLEASTRTEVANAKLVTMEKQAFELLHHGQREVASTMLFSKEYEDQKKVYAEGIELITISIQESVKDHIKVQYQQAFLTFVAILIALPCIIFAWMYVLRLMSRYSTERKQMEEDMKLLNESLEKRVIERTQKLKEKNLTLLNEIVGREQAEEKLKNSSAILKNIINSIPDMVFVKDLELRTIMCNNAFASTVGKKPEELIGKTDIENGWNPELVHGNPEKGIRGFENDDRQALKGQLVHSPFGPVNVGDEVRFFDTKKLAMLDANDVTIGLLGVARDITERNRAEETLLLHSKILENMNEGVNLVKASDGLIAFTNIQFNNLFGYEHGELVGKHVSVLSATVGVTPEEKAKETIRELDDKGSWAGEICNIRKDGTEFWCRAKVSSFNHPKYGDVWVSVHEDITDRKQKEEELENYGMLLDNISDLSYICDTEGNILFLNRIFEKLSGRKVEEFIGKSFAPLFEGEDMEKAMDAYSRTLKGESTEEEICFKDTGVLCEYKGLPLRNEEGEIVGILGTARDITERKRIDKQIEASLKEKDVLLGEIHHRVKNNLQIISSLLDMSSMQTQNKETIELFKESRNRVETMSIIHSQLYESERFDEINMGWHLQELSGNLLKVYLKKKQ